MPPAMLVLWDVDHTLMDTGGIGSEVYAAAFEKVTGRALEQMADVFGRTEPVIFRETLKLHDIKDPDDLFTRFAREQAIGYAERSNEMRQRGRALPGAADALRVLYGRDEVVQSVLTGNTRPSAEIKLRTFGLDRNLDLDIGAYGTDDDIRARLVDIGRQRATRRTASTSARQPLCSSAIPPPTSPRHEMAPPGSLPSLPAVTAKTTSPPLALRPYSPISPAPPCYWPPSTQANRHNGTQTDNTYATSQRGPHQMTLAASASASIDAATVTGASALGYAPTPGDHERLATRTQRLSSPVSLTSRSGSEHGHCRIKPYWIKGGAPVRADRRAGRCHHGPGAIADPDLVPRPRLIEQGQA